MVILPGRPGSLTLAPARPLSSHPLNQDLLAWWLAQPWQVGALTWFDLVGGNHGALRNMAAASETSGWAPASRANAAGRLEFDGSDDFVNVPNHRSFMFAGTQSFSVACWILVRSVFHANSFPLSTFGNATPGYWFVRILGSDNGAPLTNTLSCGFNDGTLNTMTNSTLDLTVGGWHHIVFVVNREAQTLLQYIDGAQNGNGSITTNVNLYNGQPLTFGQLGNSSAFHTGALDDIRLYNRALRASEAQQLYTESLLGYPTALVQPRRWLPHAGILSSQAAAPAPVKAQWKAVTPTVTGTTSVAPGPVKAQWQVPTPTFGTQPLAPSPVTGQWTVLTPVLSPTRALQPTPMQATWAVPTPHLPYQQPLHPTPVKARWRPLAPHIFLTNVFLQPTPVKAQWKVVPPTIRREVLPPAVLTDTFVAGDWLVQAPAIGLKLSYDYNPDGTWEHRIAALGDIEWNAPPAGGLVAIVTATVDVIESGRGQSLLALWQTAPMVGGVPCTIDFLPRGGTPQRLFTGRIDSLEIANALTRLTIVDDSVHANPKLPRTLVTLDVYSFAASFAVDQPIPLVYGRGSALLGAPMLLVQTAQVSNAAVADSGARDPLYKVANHAMHMNFGVAYYNDATQTYMGALTDGLPSVEGATLQLVTPLPQTLINPIDATWTVFETSGVVAFPEAAIDGNSATIALMIPTALNSYPDGYGLLGVAVNPTSNQRGNNQWQLTLTNHRRAPQSDPTVTGTFLMRTINLTTGAVLRDNLYRTEAFRHSLNPRTTVHTVTGLTLGPAESIEVLCLAEQEGGPTSTISNYYEIGEIALQLRFQAPGDNAPLYLYQLRQPEERFNSHFPWDGRLGSRALATAWGLSAHTFLSYIGTAEGQVIQRPHETIASLLYEELLLPFDLDSFQQAGLLYTTRNWYTDGAIGAGWSQARSTGREVLDAVARACAATLIPGPTGAWQLLPYDPDHTAVAFAFDPGTVLTAGDRTLTTLPTPLTRESSLHVTLGSMQDIHSRFEVHYAYNAGARKFDKVWYIDQHGTNAVNIDGIETLDLVLRCSRAAARFGQLEPLVVETPWLGDDRSAALLLQHLVHFWSDQRLIAEWDGPLSGLALRPGMFVTLDHPFLPANLQGAIFELHTVRLSPTVGRIHYKASRTAALPSQVVPPCQPLPDALSSGLVLAWEFDEASGTRADLTHLADLADLHGTVGQQVGRMDYAATFFAQRQSVLTRDDPPALFRAAFTLALWVYPFGDVQETAVLVSRGQSLEDSSWEYFIALEPEGHLSMGFGGGLAQGGAELELLRLPGRHGPVQAQQWNLLLITYDGTTLNLLINNEQVARALCSGFGVAGDASWPLNVGAIGNATAWFDGAIDTTMLWDRILTADESTAVWNEAIGGCPHVTTVTTVWTQESIFAVAFAEYGGAFFGGFGSQGTLPHTRIYQRTASADWNEQHDFGNVHTQIYSLLVYQGLLYACLSTTDTLVPGVNELWAYDGSSWVKKVDLTEITLAAIVHSDGNLYMTTDATHSVGPGGNRLYRWNGTALSQTATYGGGTSDTPNRLVSFDDHVFKVHKSESILAYNSTGNTWTGDYILSSALQCQNIILYQGIPWAVMDVESGGVRIPQLWSRSGGTWSLVTALDATLTTITSIVDVSLATESGVLWITLVYVSGGQAHTRIYAYENGAVSLSHDFGTAYTHAYGFELYTGTGRVYASVALLDQSVNVGEIWSK